MDLLNATTDVYNLWPKTTSDSTDHVTPDVFSVAFTYRSEDDILMSSSQRNANSTDTNIMSVGARISLAVVVVVTVFVGSFGNGIVCMLVYRKAAMRSAINLLVAHLALADILLVLLVAPFVLTGLVDTKLEPGPTVCALLAFLQDVLVAVGTLILLAIGTDRYLIIVRHKEKLNVRRARVVILLSWLTAVTASLPPLVGWGQFGAYPGHPLCPRTLDKNTGEQSYIVISVVLTRFAPFTAMFFTCTCIVTQVRKNSLRVRHYPLQVSVTQSSRNSVPQPRPSVTAFFRTARPPCDSPMTMMHQSDCDSQTPVLRPLCSKTVVNDSEERLINNDTAVVEIVRNKGTVCNKTAENDCEERLPGSTNVQTSPFAGRCDPFLSSQKDPALNRALCKNDPVLDLALRQKDPGFDPSSCQKDPARDSGLCRTDPASDSALCQKDPALVSALCQKDPALDPASNHVDPIPRYDPKSSLSSSSASSIKLCCASDCYCQLYPTKVTYSTTQSSQSAAESHSSQQAPSTRSPLTRVDGGLGTHSAPQRPPLDRAEGVVGQSGSKTDSNVSWSSTASTRTLYHFRQHSSATSSMRKDTDKSSQRVQNGNGLPPRTTELFSASYTRQPARRCQSDETQVHSKLSSNHSHLSFNRESKRSPKQSYRSPNRSPNQSSYSPAKNSKSPGRSWASTPARGARRTVSLASGLPRRVLGSTRRHMLDVSFKTRAFKTILILSFLLILCWTPYTMSVLITGLTLRPHPGLLCFLLVTGLAKSALNPVVYAVRIRKFRAALRLVLPQSLSTDMGCSSIATLISKRRVNPSNAYRCADPNSAH